MQITLKPGNYWSCKQTKIDQKREENIKRIGEKVKVEEGSKIQISIKT